MKALKIVIGVLVIALVVVGYVAPIGPMPGMFIGGNPAPFPTNWDAAHDAHEIRLQVGDGPVGRTVIIWMVDLDGDLHVLGSKDSGWTRAIGEGGPVRVRLGDSVYDLNASRITANWERVVEAWAAKYREDYPEIVAGFPDSAEAANTAMIYKLARRS